MRYATDRTLFLIAATVLLIATIAVVIHFAGLPRTIGEIWPNFVPA